MESTGAEPRVSPSDEASTARDDRMKPLAGVTAWSRCGFVWVAWSPSQMAMASRGSLRTDLRGSPAERKGTGRTYSCPWAQNSPLMVS